MIFPHPVQARQIQLLQTDSSKFPENVLFFKKFKKLYFVFQYY